MSRLAFSSDCLSERLVSNGRSSSVTTMLCLLCCSMLRMGNQETVARREACGQGVQSILRALDVKQASQSTSLRWACRAAILPDDEQPRAGGGIPEVQGSEWQHVEIPWQLLPQLALHPAYQPAQRLWHAAHAGWTSHGERHLPCLPQCNLQVMDLFRTTTAGAHLSPGHTSASLCVPVDRILQ